MDNFFHLLKHIQTGKYAQKGALGFMGYRKGKMGAIAFLTIQEAERAQKDFPGTFIETVCDPTSEIIFGTLEPIWNYDVTTYRRKYMVTGYNTARAFAGFIGGALIVSENDNPQYPFPTLVELEGVKLEA